MKLYYNIVLTIIRMTYISQGFLLNHKILYNYITTARIVILVLLIYGVGIMYRIYIPTLGSLKFKLARLLFIPGQTL